ncbi:hypothetical protein WJX74_006002 [Apatococcus lobatus]|uniref:Uncharacterized protein n=1 Tax=Apatococcus lobatus TaxID=904363 RepID=A0AAW1RR86_9CHLO
MSTENLPNLRELYKRMDRSFLQSGLDLPAVQHTRRYYANPDTSPSPHRYVDFPAPQLQALDVRLLAFLIAENQQLADMAVSATKAIFEALPAGMQVHMGQPMDLHMTVFMTSHPFDVRRNPFTSPSGLPAEWSAAASQANADRERAAVQQLIVNAHPPQLQVEQIVLANSGTLLLCFSDFTSHLQRLRAALRQAFPGAPSKQSSICHVTLGRILSLQQLHPEQAASVHARCQEWSCKLHGMRYNPTHVWHILEETFTKVDGHRQKVIFGSKGP